jgi:hypothetical protein
VPPRGNDLGQRRLGPTKDVQLVQPEQGFLADLLATAFTPLAGSTAVRHTIPVLHTHHMMAPSHGPSLGRKSRIDLPRQ